MASMQDGTIPVGRSFEVKAPTPTDAEVNARALVDFPAGRVLFVEQVEAGTFEVVIEDLSDKPEQALLMEFFAWLHDSTDTFDPVLVAMVLDDDKPALGFDENERDELVRTFLASRAS